MRFPLIARRSSTPDDAASFYIRRPLPAEYDIMIHVDESTATARLPFRYD